MTFIRLHVTAEGQTEERFVKQVLTPHLGQYDISVDARCVLTSKDKKKHKEYRGGLFSYEKARFDITTWMKEDRNDDCRFTTMFDLYALPANFPGFEKSRGLSDPYQKVAEIEDSFQKDISDPRFIPYIQLHEFETLILADPQKLELEYFDCHEQIENICMMVEKEGGNPELIDEGNETAPSKRILKKIPEYDKANAGPDVTRKIGLTTLRKKCSHFNEWLKQLENLSS